MSDNRVENVKVRADDLRRLLTVKGWEASKESLWKTAKAERRLWKALGVEDDD